MIDDEVKMIVSEAHTEARRILLEKREVLEIVTRRLLEKEVMEGDELREILEGTHISDQNDKRDGHSRHAVDDVVIAAGDRGNRDHAGQYHHSPPQGRIDRHDTECGGHGTGNMSAG